ncbi:MAG: hypothetical protein ACLGGX_03430 [Bdellovibrionia bacterium]
MRIICLKFSKNIDRSYCEAFTAITPQVQFRPPHFIFLDISSTSHLLGGENETFRKVLEIAQKLPSHDGEVQIALADRPYSAQALCEHREKFISPRGKDRESLKDLSLEAILSLEGLRPWGQRSQLLHIIDFFKSLGLFTIEGLQKFRLLSLKERWGDVGTQLGKRLLGTEVQILSPFLVQEPLYGYHYFEEPASLVPQISSPLFDILHFRFMRLEGRARYAKKIELTFYCEYSSSKYHFHVEPVAASRDLNLFLDLCNKKLEKLSLENPIREFEVDIFDVPEKVQQLDFFEPRDHSEQKWQRLLSFASDFSCEMGFLQTQSEIFPEKSFTLKQELPTTNSVNDKKSLLENAQQIKRAFSKSLEKAPRPSLLLEQPEALSEISSIRFLSRLPTERLESGWWNLGEKELKHRDYYFALNALGQLLWVFQDRMSQQYYLHGYFD